MLPGRLDATCAEGKPLMHPRQVSRTTWVDGTQRTNLVRVRGQRTCCFSSDIGFASFSVPTRSLPRLFPAGGRYVEHHTIFWAKIQTDAPLSGVAFGGLLASGE